MVDARDSAIPWDYFYCNLSRILLDYLLTIRFCCCYYHCLISKILFFWKERGSFQIYKKIVIIFVSTEDHNRWRFLFSEDTEDHNRTTSIHPSIACRSITATSDHDWNAAYDSDNRDVHIVLFGLLCGGGGGGEILNTMRAPYEYHRL